MTVKPTEHDVELALKNLQTAVRAFIQYECMGLTGVVDVDLIVDWCYDEHYIRELNRKAKEEEAGER